MIENQPDAGRVRPARRAAARVQLPLPARAVGRRRAAAVDRPHARRRSTRSAPRRRGCSRTTTSTRLPTRYGGGEEGRAPRPCGDAPAARAARARSSSTRARSSVSRRSSSPTSSARIRSSSARTASGSAGTAAACRSRGAAAHRASASRPARRGCRCRTTWRAETVEAQARRCGLEPRALPAGAGAPTRLRGASRRLVRMAREPCRDARLRAHRRRRDGRVRGEHRRRAAAAAGGRARARERAS